MVKGCQRRVLHLKNPEGGLFEEAFFFLRAPDVTERGGGHDMVAEANRILLGCQGDEPAPKRRPRGATLFLLGVLTGAVLTAALLFVLGTVV